MSCALTSMPPARGEVWVATELLIDTGGARAAVVHYGERLLTHGRFIETKKHPPGFCPVELPDLDTAGVAGKCRRSARRGRGLDHPGGLAGRSGTKGGPWPRPARQAT